MDRLDQEWGRSGATGRNAPAGPATTYSPEVAESRPSMPLAPVFFLLAAIAYVQPFGLLFSDPDRRDYGVVGWRILAHEDLRTTSAILVLAFLLGGAIATAIPGRLRPLPLHVGGVLGTGCGIGAILSLQSLNQTYIQDLGLHASTVYVLTFVAGLAAVGAGLLQMFIGHRIRVTTEGRTRIFLAPGSVPAVARRPVMVSPAAVPLSPVVLDPVTMSPDGQWWWDGASWNRVASVTAAPRLSVNDFATPITSEGVFSADGHWRWDGLAWQARGSEALVSPFPGGRSRTGPVGN